MTTQRIFIILFTITLIGLLQAYISKSRYGRAMRAVQQDPYVARLQGISVKQVTIMTLTLGGALAGIAGALVAPEQVLTPGMGASALLLGFVAIILGGMGSVVGALAAAVIIGIVQSVVSTYWIPEAATWTSFLMALIILTIRPRGLFGHE